jgi:hypothetical protein
VGDTHLETFNGLLYDFQASGDFVLAEGGSDFAVQARQLSGAPTWPNASINNAVAARMGTTKIALCLTPDEGDQSGRLFIDGQATELSDGTPVYPSPGVDVLRKGNVYLIRGQTGDSVRAVVNPSWIDVSIGLGRWPANVRGLLANAHNSVDQLLTAGGTILRKPLSFEDLYSRDGLVRLDTAFVAFLGEVLEWENGVDVAHVGGGIAMVIAAVAFMLHGARSSG